MLEYEKKLRHRPLGRRVYGEACGVVGNDGVARAMSVGFTVIYVYMIFKQLIPVFLQENGSYLMF